MNIPRNQVYLFIIWERSRIKEEEIIGKLKNEFQILDMYEIKWSKGSFENNIRRFYGSKLQDVKMKIKDCGDGPFLLVILRDNNCKFDYKRTAFGIEKVNQNIYDKKHELRRMTNTGFAIHSSLNQKETNEDITLLMGKNLDDYIKEINGNWDGIVEKIETDIVGEHGWKDAEEFLYVINSTCNYVILRNYEKIEKKLENYFHNDIDILTDDFIKFPYIANGGRSPYSKNLNEKIKISNKNIKLDIGFPSDGYYDEKWMNNVLKNKKFQNGKFIPSNEDYFFSLLYHSIKSNNYISNEYLSILKRINTNHLKLNLFENDFNDKVKMKKVLIEYMKNKKYLDTDSKKYKFLNLIIFRYISTSKKIYQNHGKKFLFEVYKTKLKRIFLK